jgi:dTDP-4-amino-4,6-dideoxygalactose transaminase
MIKEKIWLSSPHMGEKEFEFVKEAFDTNWIAPLGPHVDGFEMDLEERLDGGVQVAALSSGTAALHLGLILLGVEPGDEVICQSMTFSASANPIAYQRAVPVFIDSERETWNMDPVLLKEAIKDRISKGKKPKAIIVVHLYGMPAKMVEILAIAKEFEIPVLEDAAEALGSSLNGRQMGTFGDIAILSFNGNKIITTSGGGALVAKNGELVKMARFLATQARDAAPHYQHSQIGYNYRMSNVCAAIGRGQMTVLTDRVEQRRRIHEYYKNTFKDIKGLIFLEEPKGFYSNRWLSTVIVEGEVSREEIRLALEEENIEARPLWKPMHMQPVFREAPVYENGVSEYLFDKGLCLPSGSNLTNQELERVSEKVIQMFGQS